MMFLRPRWIIALSLAVGIATIGLAPALVSSSATASVEDFSFQAMSVNYELSRGVDGEALLTAREHLEAVFPQEDQNHGIIRAIPLSMHGLSTNPTVLTVTDGEGTPRAFEIAEDGGFLLVTIASDSFVHGVQVYEITYTQTNVVSEPTGPDGPQELYLDVNGSGWSQPFDLVSATVALSPDVAGTRTGDAACYKGFEGSTSPCDRLEKPVETTLGSPESATLTVEARNLSAGETLTFALGFQPRTFVLPDMSFWAHPLAWLFVVLSSLLVVLTLVCVALRFAVWGNAKGRGIVVAQYEEPAGMFPLVASDIVGRTRRAMPAALMALAVRGRIAVYEQERSRGKTGFDLELASLERLDPEETRTLEAVFGANLSVGLRANTREPNAFRAVRMRALVRNTSSETESLGFRAQSRPGLRRTFLGLALALATTTFVIGLIITTDGHVDLGSGLMTFVGTFLATVVVVSALGRVRPLTDAGALAREHLRGLKLFIGLAEADRIAFLQSPTGAERLRVSGSRSKADTKKLVRIYERALPYAMLFGFEKEWAKVLANVYDQASDEPTWFIGSAQFNAVAFTVGLNNFAASTTAAWAQSDASAGGAGSSGGGSAGGGGGGGGGGGV